MNTYNENLRSSVVASLQSQELDKKAVLGKRNTSMFTLYHAEGATITASEKLQQAGIELGGKAAVKDQAVITSNISNNQVLSAKQANQYIRQSITNTAVSAANVQVASNSIVRLASGIGSIYSIVNAADFGTDIYNQTKEALNLINQTAYEAETASQLAMEASMLTSKVSASTVTDKSISTNTIMANMLKVASAEFSTVSQAVVDANALVAATSAKEKVAEGIYVDSNADNESTISAYTLTNAALNLNLTAAPKGGSENNIINVGFNLIRNPFAPPLVADNTAPDISEVVYPPAPLNIDPDTKLVKKIIENYYLIFSKNSKKTTFSISNAESILNSPQQFVALNLKDGSTEGINIGNTVITYNYDKHCPDSVITGLHIEIPFMKMLDTLGNLYNLQDTDGDPIVPGTQYVVFVMAEYVDEYKKKLNNYDDFLSAPSAPFCLINILNAVTKPVFIKSAGYPFDVSLNIPADFDAQSAATPGDTYWVAFNVTEQTIYNVHYRCMFLPASDNLTSGMLTDSEAAAVEEEVKSLQAIAELYDPLIAAAQTSILELSPQISIAQALVNDLNTKVNDTDATTEEAKMHSSALVVATKSLTALQSNLKTQTNALLSNQKDKLTALDNLTVSVVDNPGFIFNLEIAEQVLAGNYTCAKPISPSAAATLDDAVTDVDQTTKYFCSIGPETTDVFGNPLMDKNSYHLVVLSFSAAEEENLSMFENKLSAIDIASPSPFIYTAPTN